MIHQNVLNPAKSALIVIDIQEAFRKAITDFSELAGRALTAIWGFQALESPVFITEQYPKGLGRTAEEIVCALPDDLMVYEKTTFSACGSETLVFALEDLGISQVVICGIETHICVSQTAHDLLHRGYQVHLLTDCVRSRSESDRAAGIAKMQASGVITSSVEMAVFEMMGDSKHPKFKEIQQLFL